MKSKGKKKNAVMLADTRPALVGTVLLQLQRTNPGLFDEALIYYIEPIDENNRKCMSSIMPCRFVHYKPPLPETLFKKERFKLFSALMFARYEMFSYLDEFETITWLDTDILVQGDLSKMIDKARLTGAALICEDPINKTAEKPDRMRTCFTSDLSEYRTDAYLYCSGTIVITDKIHNVDQCTQWCYSKTIQWADILSLPDQGVLNAAIQEFDINVTPLAGKDFCCYPYMGRDCSDATIIHAWGLNKFWNDWYVNQHYTGWSNYYNIWRNLGGCNLPFEIFPRISVIIPTYKPNPEFLRQCIDSLMAQKRLGWERFSDFEIIIISEPVEVEPLQELIDSYQDKRIRLVINSERIGIAASLNRGLRLAQGKYIARIDDDDLASPERLFLQAEYLDAHENIILCTSDFEYFGDMNEKRISFEGEMSRAWSIFTCPFDHPTIMFRKDFFLDNNLFYDECRGYVEDWELWLRAFSKGMTVGCIHKVLFYHRWINSGSAGQTNKTIEMMQDLIQKNFLLLGVVIPDDDLSIIGPWNGRLINESDIERLKYYFSLALQNNMIKKYYNQDCLKKVFDLRLMEAKTGVLPDIVEKIETMRDSETIKLVIEEGNNKKVSILKRIVKSIIKPIYRPLKHRFEDRLVNIQESGWVNEGHLMNCIHKMDQMIIMQNEQLQILNERLDKINCLCNDIRDNFDNFYQIGREIEGKLDETKCKTILVGDKIYDLSQKIRYQQGILTSNLQQRKKIILIGTPEHSNIGDAAITIGEIEFVRKYFADYQLIELSSYDFNEWYDQLASIINSDDLLMLQGGGNLGNKYILEENIRRRVILDFPFNRIIILPQTIYFDNSVEGQKELNLSALIYNQHQNLLLFTRGPESLALAKRYFPQIKSEEMLDMALQLDEELNIQRSGLLLCIRDLNDESGLTDEQYQNVEKVVKEIDSHYVKINNLNNGNPNDNIFRDMRRTVVTSELRKFSKCKAVITDRLHGLIFSIITHTPCVVLSAYNQKIREFCTFFSSSNSVFFIDNNLDLLENTINKAVDVNYSYYPALEEYTFEKLAERIKKM